jgi:hypothetical protein
MLVLAALSALYLVALVIAYMRLIPGRDAPPLGDFFAFWSFARFAAENPAAAIYDPAQLGPFQHALDARFHSFYPFPYPPIFLLILRPLAALPFIPAYFVWIGLTFVAYLLAAAPGPWPRIPRLALAAAAPSTLFSLFSGQNGLLTAALLVGGLRVVGSRPVLGGMLLGALVYKPQMAVLVPIALLSARCWRGLLAAALTIVGLSAICAAAFGPEIWPAWVHGIPVYLSLIDAHRNELAQLMPTVTAALVTLGVPPAPQQAVQLVLTCSVGLAVWHLFRAGTTPLAIAFLAAGMFVATPYALIYDLPALTLAVIIAYEAGAVSGRPWRQGELLVMFLALLLPVTNMGSAAGPVVLNSVLKATVLMLLLGVIWRLAKTMPEARVAPAGLSSAGTRG